MVDDIAPFIVRGEKRVREGKRGCFPSVADLSEPAALLTKDDGLLNPLTAGGADDVACLINGTEQGMIDKAVVFKLINQKAQRGAAHR